VLEGGTRAASRGSRSHRRRRGCAFAIGNGLELRASRSALARSGEPMVGPPAAPRLFRRQGQRVSPQPGGALVRGTYGGQSRRVRRTLVSGRPRRARYKWHRCGAGVLCSGAWCWRFFWLWTGLESPAGLSLKPIASRISIRGVFHFDVLAREIGSPCSGVHLICKGKLAAPW